MTATVASIITAGRYDLRDSNSRLFSSDNLELVEYLNRSLRVLDEVLSEINSDLVFTQDTSTTLSDGDNYVAKPSNPILIRDVWISTNRLIKKDIGYIYYQQKFTSDGEPNYFGEQATNIIFERDSDDDYSLTIEYDKYSDALTAGGNMPYNDDFNDSLREGMILIAKNRNEYDLTIASILHDHFMSIDLSRAFRRTFVPKRYRLGF